MGPLKSQLWFYAVPDGRQRVGQDLSHALCAIDIPGQLYHVLWGAGLGGGEKGKKAPQFVPQGLC